MSGHIEDVIEREIVIRAGMDHVWSLVTRPGWWIGDEVRFDLDGEVGETVEVDAGRHGLFPVKVERFEPPRYAAYRWSSTFPGQALTDGTSTLIEITLREHEGGVLLRLRESGFASLSISDERRVREREANVEGWGEMLDNLRGEAESQVDDAGRSLSGDTAQHGHAG